ncbi:MAG: WG repeat-containing protein [Alphaproteobacteria bacterium]|nr:WG repeat-containing protein [Alphaproteobacteria bacterium]
MTRITDRLPPALIGAIWLMCATALSVHAEEFPTPFEENGLIGYRGAQGQVVIEPQYVLAGEFSAEGIAAVATTERWAYIDRTGRVVIYPYLYDNGPDYFSEGLARFEVEGRIGFFDRYGKVAIAPRFDFAWPFEEGRAVVCSGCRSQPMGEHSMMVGGKWGYIDSSGAVVIPLVFDKARSFTDGRAEVWQGDEWLFIDRDGKPIRDAD